jgi:hypothetical protein
MTREQAIAVLVTLPIAPPRRIEPAPDEIIVCECTEPLRHDAVQVLAEQLRSLWPAPHRIVIVSAGLHVYVDTLAARGA